MLQALAALFGAGFTVAACYATGILVARYLSVDWSNSGKNRSEKYPLAFMLGAACLHAAIFAVLALKIAYKPVLFALLAGVILAAVMTRRKSVPQGSRARRLPASLKIGFGLIFAAFTVVYFINAWAPESSPDGSGYHLELVARYLRERGFVRITTNMYAGLGQGVEMLFVPAFAWGRHSAAALVHLAFAIALAWAIFAYGLRIGKPWVGAAAALLTYASPIVGKTGSSAYIDVGAAAIAFSVFYWLEIWDETRDPRLLIPVGLLAGYAYAAKYTAFIMLLYALGFVAWRARKLRPVLIVGACAAVMIGPWMTKNWIYLQNPIAPFGNQIFRNSNMHPLTEQQWAEGLRSYDVQDKWVLPLEVAARGGKTEGLIGPVFLAAPLALLALRYRAGRRLLLAGSLLLAVYMANVGTRFLIPCLPFFSLAMALAIGNLQWLLVLLVMFHALTSWPWMIPRYSNRYAWRIEHFPYRAALRRIPEDRYLHEVSYGYVLARLVEQNVPRGERILSLGDIAESYTSREILVSFQASFNQMLTDGLNIGWTEAYQPTRMLAFRFPGREMRRVRLVQTARGQGLQEWVVHELRFRHRSVELPRQSDWRLRAFPNSWEVQLAFDNSPATRWKTWETAAPGMYIDVDFGHMEILDEVDMETSREHPWPIRLQVQTPDPQGHWTTLAENPDDRAIRPKGSIRRAATYEMRRRDVNYLLVKDSDWGAADFSDDPDSWGLIAVATAPGATLYKVSPISK